MANPNVSDLLFSGGAKIQGLPYATVPGQPLVFGQSLLASPYCGGLYAESGPNNTTSVSAVGVAISSTGTISTPTLNSTSIRGATRRTTISSAATAGALAGLRPSHLLCCRGSAPGFGGFRLRFSFALETIVAGNRGFAGLWDSISAPTNVDPLTSTAGNKIGVAFNANTGNLQLIHNAAGAAPTVIDLGVNAAINTSDVWLLELKCLSQAVEIDWAVYKKGLDDAIASGVASTNIPANTVFLGPQLWICNNATALACGINQVRWVLTSKN